MGERKAGSKSWTDADFDALLVPDPADTCILANVPGFVMGDADTPKVQKVFCIDLVNKSNDGFAGWEAATSAVRNAKLPWKLPMALLDQPTRTLEIIVNPVKGIMTQAQCLSKMASDNDKNPAVWQHLMESKAGLEKLFPGMDVSKTDPRVLVRSVKINMCSISAAPDLVLARFIAGKSLTASLRYVAPDGTKGIVYGDRNLGKWSVLPRQFDGQLQSCLYKLDEAILSKPWFSRMASGFDRSIGETLPRRYEFKRAGRGAGLMIFDAPPRTSEMAAPKEPLDYSGDWNLWLANFIVLSYFKHFSADMLAWAGDEANASAAQALLEMSDGPPKGCLLKIKSGTPDDPPAECFVVRTEFFRGVWQAMCRTVDREKVFSNVAFIGAEAKFATTPESARATLATESKITQDELLRPTKVQFSMRIECQAWDAAGNVVSYDERVSTASATPTPGDFIGGRVEFSSSAPSPEMLERIRVVEAKSKSGGKLTRDERSILDAWNAVGSGGSGKEGAAASVASMGTIIAGNTHPASTRPEGTPTFMKPGTWG